MIHLTQADRDRISEASEGLGKSSWARGRFAYYIRHGHCYADAVRYHVHRVGNVFPCTDPDHKDD